MPKIIENLDKKLIAEAARCIEARGYGALTIRDLAKACGVGVGTVYNYFPSKEDIVAAHLLEEWSQCVNAINLVSTHAESPRPVVRCIYDQLMFFSRHHAVIFRDEAAAATFSGAFSKYHGTLRAQLAQPLRKFVEMDFAAEFMAEALLTWTMAGKAFDEIYGMLEKLF